MKISLHENAVPRNYYANQLQKHLGRSSEVCDFVIKVADAHYDIGVIRAADGAYGLHFDAFSTPSPHVPGTNAGRGGIHSVLGVPRDPNAKDNAHHIGKLLSEYTIAASIEASEMSGYRLAERTTNKAGETVLIFA